MWQQWQEDPVCCSNGHLDKHPWWSKSMCKNWKLYQNLHTNNIIVSLLILLVSRGDYFGRLVSERAKFVRTTCAGEMHNTAFTTFILCLQFSLPPDTSGINALLWTVTLQIFLSVQGFESKTAVVLPAVKWTGGEFISVKPALGSALKTWWKHILTQIYK